MSFKKKLPARYAAILLPLFLSMMMSCLICIINTFRLVGVTEGFVGQWLASWMISWAIAFPSALVILPVVKKALSYIVEKPKDQ
jgi:hypothetical protein